MASDLNQVFVIGRLTKDLGSNCYDFSYTRNGLCIAKVSIACNQSKKQGDKWEEEANFFDVTIFGKTAENLKPYLTKGKQIGVTGSLKQDRWEKDGQKFSKVYIVAEQVQLLGGKDNLQPKNENNSSKTGYFPKTQNTNPALQNANKDIQNGEFPEDIPF